MKQRTTLTSIAICAAWALAPCLAPAQHNHLALKHGTYVQAGSRCKDAPFAAIKSWDGFGLAGPHSSNCVTRVLSQHGNQYHLNTTCTAIGDGTPVPQGQVDSEILLLIRLSNIRFAISNELKPKTTYRWCSV